MKGETRKNLRAIRGIRKQHERDRLLEAYRICHAAADRFAVNGFNGWPEPQTFEAMARAGATPEERWALDLVFGGGE